MIDYIKGLAILLVVWGHVIQYATADKNYNFYLNKVYILVYSFHMPLFVFVSGYLFYSSQLHKPFGALVKSKTLQILVPLLLWATINQVLKNAYWIIKGQLGGIFTISSFVEGVTGGLWFLWALYLSTLVNAFVSKFLRDKLLAYVLVTIGVLLLPNDYNFYLVKFVLPFFVLGYLYRKFAERLQPVRKYWLGAAIVLFPLLLLNWNEKYFIYHQYGSFHLLRLDADLLTVAYRYLIGACGIVFFVTVVRYLLFPRLEGVFSNLGKLSLGIYVISMPITVVLVPMARFSTQNEWLYSLVLTPALAVLLTAFCYYATVVITRIPFLNKWLLGGK